MWCYANITQGRSPFIHRDDNVAMSNWWSLLHGSDRMLHLHGVGSQGWLSWRPSGLTLDTYPTTHSYNKPAGFRSGEGHCLTRGRPSALLWRAMGGLCIMRHNSCRSGSSPPWRVGVSDVHGTYALELV
jgi:hypothetical protein